jgi:aspartokinase-like uncharacterized kinase
VKRRGLWVIKFGGSLARSPALRGWLDAIAAGGGRLVVVPGGGSFADEVRAMQRHVAFDDATAHRLALLAMEQYGLMLCGLQPGLRPAINRAQIARILRDGGVPVWLPTRMAVGQPDIPENWDVTSDSLAAWLAAKIQADALILVKSVPVAASTTIEDLVRLGIVDPLLPDFLARGRVACRCVDAGQHPALKTALDRGEALGVVVTTQSDADAIAAAGRMQRYRAVSGPATLTNG